MFFSSRYGAFTDIDHTLGKTKAKNKNPQLSMDQYHTDYIMCLECN